LSKPLVVSLLCAAIGVTLLTAVGASASSSARQGGTFNVDLSTDTDYTDPALAYLSSSWEMEYATGLKLMNYPDVNGPRSSQLIPEAAAGFPRVSNNGKTYDFNVNASFTKFSNGQPVTAANFKAALDRVADPKMQSPATAFISDVVGAQAVVDGKTASISGVKVQGSHLLITLTKPAPDFLSRIAMPFFSAVPVNLARDPNGVDTPPSAGPYYVASRDPNKSIVLKRNPFYKGKRAANPNQIVYTIGNSLEAIRLRVEQGASDYAAQGLPPSAYAEVAQKYGINKSQFWVKPILNTAYVALNTSRPIFKDNVALRKAVNYAVDRRALLAQAGYLAGKRTDQILPPGMAGFRDANLYPLKGPDLTTAKKLAQGHTRDGKIVLYSSNRSPGPLYAQVLEFNLKQIGLDVETKLFSRAVQIQKEGTRGEPFDMTVESWLADYADPFDFVDILLNGKNIQDANNNNYSYFDDPSYVKKMNAAAALSGPARYKAYGNLDVDLSLNAVPWVARANGNARIFVSSHVGCYTYSGIYGTVLNAVCMK
jgi:ABC-type oligopeptide transport system substrate-binding subunit